MMNRLTGALIAYVVLAVLTLSTITDPKLRAGTLLVLGLFAVKSLLRRKDVMHPDDEAGAVEKVQVDKG